MPVSENFFQKTSKKVRTVLWRFAIRMEGWFFGAGIMAILGGKREVGAHGLVAAWVSTYLAV